MLIRVGYMGVSEETWNQLEQAMPEANVGELYWRHAIIAVARNDAEGNWPKAMHALMDMAKFKSESGEPWLEYMRAAQDRYCENSLAFCGADYELLITGCACFECASVRSVLTAAEYLEFRPVPHERCLNPPCRCFAQPL